MIKIIFLCVLGFFAAFVDSIAGGGGLISVPAFMFVLPPASISYALGTNKFAATTASFTSSIGFFKSGKVNLKLLKYLIPFTLIGAVLGVNTVLSINQKYLYTIVLVLIIFIGIYTLFSKSMGSQNNFTQLTKLNIFYGMVLALLLGFYDGFLGPGTGSFLIFGLIQVYGFDFVTASANSKILNFASNITSLILFAFSHRIEYFYGVPVAICMIFGAHFGTKFALKKGIKIIKPIFIIMSLAVAVKMLLNIGFF